MGQQARHGRVVVVTDHDGDTLEDCLEGLAVALPPGLEVVVVDRCSGDGSADVAIRHPVPAKVTVVPAGDLDLVVRAASREVTRLLMLRADRRPAPGWSSAALAALDDAELVVGPDGDAGNVAIDLARLRDVRLFRGAATIEESMARARAAGARVAVEPGMRVAEARASGFRRSTLPVVTPPAANLPRHAGRVAVVLCTRDRPDHLKRCLDSLGRLDDDHHEIVVVDNNDEPAVDAGSLPPRARVVHEPRRGLDIARNRGLQESTGDVVAYIDDDCEADPSWLAALRVAFADPEVGLVTGRVRPASLAGPCQQRFEATFGFDRGSTRRRFTRWDDRPWYPLWPGPLGTGCNMAMRRGVVADIGGFDELLDVGSCVGGGGDLDLFARLLDRGTVVEYCPDALVWHHHRDEPASLTRQFRGYGEAIGAVLVKAVIERPGHRVAAVRYYVERLAMRARLAREIRAGRHLLPMRLLLADLIGQLTGPARYLGARTAARRAAVDAAPSGTRLLARRR